jgi:hypothetical protein
MPVLAWSISGYVVVLYMIYRYYPTKHLTTFYLPLEHGSEALNVLIFINYTIAGFHLGFFVGGGGQYVEASPCRRILGHAPTSEVAFRPILIKN